MKTKSVSRFFRRLWFQRSTSEKAFLSTAAVSILLLPAVPVLGKIQNSETFQWGDLSYRAAEKLDPLKHRSDWENRDLHYYQSALTPGILIRLKSDWIRFFGDLAEQGAEGPRFIVVKTSTGARAFGIGESIEGDKLQASWILASFQGSKGWELFDTPWFLSLEKRPSRITLTREGLRIDYPTRNTGYIFSMPFYGYDKPPQQSNDFASLHRLPSKGVEPWTWRNRVPASVVERADWWASVAKAYPVGFQESFRVDLKSDGIVFRQDYRWLTVQDDWGTKPIRFATLSPTLGLAWKIPGFPMKISVPVHDPDYFTALGPYVGGIDVDRLEVTMSVLQYTNELERLSPPAEFTPPQKQALSLILGGMNEKFPSGARYVHDHQGAQNLCWNVVGDVWYGRGLEFVDPALKRKAMQSLAGYMSQEILRPHTPHHGKYILRGAGIGGGSDWGDAGKFMANSLQAIWAYAEYSGDWNLIRERWDLIKRFFVTPEVAYWTTYGRVAIAELGDEAPSSSSYARMAWKVQDYDAYLLGAYMFARQLVHHYVKQRGSQYFLAHQPYNRYERMPAEVFPTHVSTSTVGWNVDGPAWGYDVPHHEHQSTNRWVRFHDPDVGRFYRDHLKDDVRRELDWYIDAVKQNRQDVQRIDKYAAWFQRDAPHAFTSVARLRSFLLGERYEELRKTVEMTNYRARRASAIALGYSYLRSMVPVSHVRLVDRVAEPSPFVLGLQRRGLEDSLTTIQAIEMKGLTIEPFWRGWGIQRAAMGARTPQNRSFGTIEGNFAARTAGIEGSRWISYGSYVYWVDSIAERKLGNPQAILREQDRTPVAVIGAFSNESDNEVTSVSYPPEKETNANARYQGIDGMVSWQPSHFDPGRRIELPRPATSNRVDEPGSIGYALQHVWSPEEMDVYLLAGEQGGVQAWIGETQAISYHGRHRRKLQPDTQRGLGRLEKGWNRILVKVETRSGNIVIQFRLVHPDGQPIPGLKFAAFPPHTAP